MEGLVPDPLQSSLSWLRNFRQVVPLCKSSFYVLYLLRPGFSIALAALASSWVLGLKACATTPRSSNFLNCASLSPPTHAELSMTPCHQGTPR